MTCPYCGSNRIEQGIAWGKSAETGNVGLKFNCDTGYFDIVCVAQAYSDLCLNCKSILRTYIKEDTDKDWNHDPGSFGCKQHKNDYHLGQALYPSKMTYS